MQRPLGSGKARRQDKGIVRNKFQISKSKNQTNPKIQITNEIQIPNLLCHCDHLSVIASPDLSGRGNLVAPAWIAELVPRHNRGISLLATTKKECLCERGECRARQSQSSSYRSCHSLFILLISWTFFCLEPAFICFSLRMAFCMSSRIS